MFTLFWTYVSFSQLVIMWSGNLPEEITWYIARMNGGWGWIAVLLVFFQWMFPFLILLSQDIKKQSENDPHDGDLDPDDPRGGRDLAD